MRPTLPARTIVVRSHRRQQRAIWSFLLAATTLATLALMAVQGCVKTPLPASTDAINALAAQIAEAIHAGDRRGGPLASHISDRLHAVADLPPHWAWLLIEDLSALLREPAP
jgi:hypothetical protein